MTPEEQEIERAEQERADFEVRRVEQIARLTQRMAMASAFVARYVREDRADGVLVKDDPRIAPIVRQVRDYQLQIKRWCEMPYGNADVVLMACLNEGAAA